jgi:hypothetical protein
MRDVHAEKVEKSPGYAGNGESEFTRSAARGQAIVGDDPQITTISRIDEVIARNFRQLRKIEEKLCRESNPSRAGKLARSQEIKMQFIAQLIREKENGTASSTDSHTRPKINV